MNGQKRPTWVIPSGLVLACVAGWAQPLAAQSAGQAPQPTVIRTINVPLDGVATLRMSPRGVGAQARFPAIGTVRVEKMGLLRVQPLADDQSALLLRGLVTGVTRVELTAVDGQRRETYEVLILPDTDLLRYLLRQVAPTANVAPLATGSGLVLTGTVGRAGDVQTILAIAGSYTAAAATAPVNADPRSPQSGPRR